MIKYLITDPTYYSDNEQIFKEKLIKVLKNHKVDIACFRDKKSNNFEELAKIFIEVCKNYEIKNILLNSNYHLAKKLNATGVHLTSTQFNDIKNAKELGLYTIISCHNNNEIEEAIKSNIDAITFSPIFETPNKGEPKGVEKLKKILNQYKNINIIALGGIVTKEHIEEISKTKTYGFASIRYFI